MTTFSITRPWFPITQVPANHHGYSIPQFVTNSTTTSIVAAKINQGLTAVKDDVISLPSKPNLERFSVRFPVGHQFVHVYKSNKGPLVFVKCCSGICSLTYGKKINLRAMDAIELRPHLTVFKGYIDQFGQNHQLVSSLINQNTENENSESISLEETGIDKNAGVGVCSDRRTHRQP